MILLPAESALSTVGVFPDLLNTESQAQASPDDLVHFLARVRN
jgi:hypothetical protein